MKKVLNPIRNQGSSKKVLITGIAGFAGSHLAEYLYSQKFTVFGFFLSNHLLLNLSHLKDKINLIECDLLDSKKVEKSVKLINPDYVFHLAAFSSPKDSFKNPKETLKNNIFGQINLLEALAKIKSNAKILIVGSADEYGQVDSKYLPIKEKTPLSPISPYAVSKVAQDMLGLQFFLHYGLQIVRVRPFNHIGPRQSLSFVVPSFAAQIAELEKKGGGIIKVGNLENSRDFTDVRDMVRAYWLALEKGKYGEVYNVGLGKALKIADILKMMIGLSKVKIIVKKDTKRIPPQDIETIYCNYSKFKKTTGWQPQIPIIQTLSDTIEYERAKLKQ